MELFAALMVIIGYIDGSDRSLNKLLHALHVISDAVWKQVDVINPLALIAKAKEAEQMIVKGQLPAWVPGAIQYVLELLLSYLKSKS